MRLAYEKWNPGGDAKLMLARANQIATDYARQGYDLTLRQLYYQFVARGYLPNTQQSYNKLGTVVNKGRMAGFLDWDHVVDRTRNLESLSHWDSPHQIVHAISRQFHMDRWETQETRIEVWVEKEALAGVIERAAERVDVSWFSCRGYVSQSEMWGAAQRLRAFIEAGQNVIVLHLGDHDPSGIDMTRDIDERLTRFICYDYFRNNRGEFGDNDTPTFAQIMKQMTKRCGGRGWLEVRRIALNMDQVEQYDPPPNPAKITDTRARGYMELYGDESWELDALDPAVLDDLITTEIEAVIAEDPWSERQEEERRHRELLRAASERWGDVVEYLERGA